MSRQLTCQMACSRARRDPVRGIVLPPPFAERKDADDSGAQFEAEHARRSLALRHVTAPRESIRAAVWAWI
jgi:hypothetical protein